MGGLVLNGFYLLSVLRRRHQNSILKRVFLNTYFHFLLWFTFVTVLFIDLCLLLLFVSPAARCVSWYWSCFTCSGFTYEIYSGGAPSTYIYCMVCYRVIAAPYVRSVVVSLRVQLHSWWRFRMPIDYELFLLPKFFFLIM